MPIICITLPTTAPKATTARPTKNSHGSSAGTAMPLIRNPTNMMPTAVQAAGVLPWLWDMTLLLVGRPDSTDAGDCARTSGGGVLAPVQRVPRVARAGLAAAGRLGPAAWWRPAAGPDGRGRGG